MIDIPNRSYAPSLEELSEFISNPLFDEMTAYLSEQCRAKHEMAYSAENFLPGWNVRFFRSGKTLCRLYPKQGFFTALVVVGRKEKTEVELLLPQMSAAMRKLYDKTQEGMGQRWLITELKSKDAMYGDLLTIVNVRMRSK